MKLFLSTQHSALSTCLSLILLGSAMLPIRTAPAEDLKLWYAQPATTWMTEALPIGNGRLGGMIFGGVAQEHIQFNEDSLWTGGPSDLAGNVPGGAEQIATIQGLLAAGQNSAATGLIQRYLYGNPRNFGAYQPFGDVLIDVHTPADAAAAKDYRRELDLGRGVASVHYTIAGVPYDRQYFCSYPDQVMVMRLTCGKPGGVNVTLHLQSPQPGVTVRASGSKLVLTGTLPGNRLGFGAVLSLRPEGASAEAVANGPAVQVSSADALTLYLAAGTAYDPTAANYRGRDFATANDKAIIAVKYRSNDDLQTAHENDYSGLFDRVALDLGNTDAEKLPTDQRLAAFHKGDADPGLEALFFQYNRYLLISCSRPGGLPANRQGLWNNDLKAAWGADFPTMMNLEMNYLPAETANLSECAQPLIALIDRLRSTGRITAKTVYGAPGWVVNYTTNPWGFAAGGTSPYQYFPAGAAWLCQDVWEHYAFSHDQDYLQKTAYPVMKEAAEFWAAHLIADTDGTLVSSPSESPEHGGFVAGAAMDQEIVWDLFTNCIAASNALNVDDEFRAKLTDLLAKLSGPKIGRLGQLQEWKADVDDPKDTHRHISHLFALYPGHQISVITTPALAAAAKKSLELRGDGGIGWAQAWKIGYWARLGEGDHARLVLDSLMTPTDQTSSRSTAAGTYANLFTARPPLQVDGSFAALGAMAEMLVQSQDGEIHLLPALPKAWTAGSVRGLKARGGFEVDEAWADGKLTDATIRASAPGVCRVRSATPVTLNGNVSLRRPEADVVEFDATAGGSYRIVPTP